MSDTRTVLVEYLFTRYLGSLELRMLQKIIPHTKSTDKIKAERRELDLVAWLQGVGFLMSFAAVRRLHN